MPVTPSARKALRSSIAKRAHNSLLKAELKRALKTVKPESLAKTISTIDKAAKRNIIHQNKAARIKAQLAKNLGNPTAKATPKRKTTAKKAATKTKAKASKAAKQTKK